MATQDRTGFGHDTTTDEVLEGIDLTGKTVLVTGGSSGLGAETARALASTGAEVVLTARDRAKGETVASKTANVLFAVELDRRLAGQGVRAFAVHPGVVMTELSRHLVPEDLEELRSRAPGGRLRMKSVEAGAATSVYAATAPELDGRGGLYLEDCHVADVDDESTFEGVRSYAVDPDAARRLWARSEELVGQTF